MPTRLTLLLCTAAWICSPHLLLAGPEDEARKLHEEAIKILKSGSGMTLDPKQYAECVVKLEQAMNLLDSSANTESALAQEVNASLYWARKFTTSSIIDELQKQKGGKADMPPPPPKVAPPKAKPAEEPEDKEDAAATAAAAAQAEAKKVFSAGQQFANQHSSDDYAVALRWFQVADQIAGSDYSVKALALARDAQQRFSAKEGKAKAEVLPDTPAMKLVLDADSKIPAGQLEEAIRLLLDSIKVESTIAARRRLGHAYFGRAQQQKDALDPVWQAAQDAWQQAKKEATEIRRLASGGTYKRFNRRHPAILAARQKIDAFAAKAKVALKNYDLAADQFRAVMNMSPNGKDLDAAAHRAFCYSVRGDATIRASARQFLNEVLSDYKPANDLERTVYEYCKTELARLNK